MPEIRSQIASDQYRNNWDRLFRPKTTVTVYEALAYCGIPVQINDAIPKDEVWLVSENHIDKIVNIGASKNA